MNNAEKAILQLQAQARQGNLIALQTYLEQLLMRSRVPVSVRVALPSHGLIIRLLPIETDADALDLDKVAPKLEKALQELAVPEIKQVRLQYKSHERRFSLNPPPKATYTPRKFGLDVEGWRALAIGLVLALIIYHVPLLSTAFHGFPLMIHELGHTIVHWLFGRPAIPTIDFAFGGGIAIVFPQSIFLLILIYGALVGLAYLCRQYVKVLVVIGSITAIYTYCLFTRTNEMLAVGMGHGLELLAIVLCFYFCLGKYFCPFAGERTIYAMLGFFTVFHDARFAWNIVRDSSWREIYLRGKGGLLDHDLVILAQQYFYVNFETIANMFLVCCWLAPLVAVLVFVREKSCQRAIEWLWE